MKLHLPERIPALLEWVSEHMKKLLIAKRDSIELEFWHSADPNIREPGFGYLSAALTSLEIEDMGLNSLPTGYRHVLYVLQWEYERQSEGWIALDNYDGSMEHVISNFAAIGLPKEAEAIEAAHNQWLIDNMDLGGIRSAYCSITTEMPDDGDRIDFLLNFLHENAARLFYEFQTETGH